MTFHCGEVGGICRWSVTIGKVGDEEIDAFVENVRGIAQAARPGYVVLDIVHGISLPTPLQRKRVAEAVATAAAKTPFLAAHALATNSAAARGVLTAVNWFVRRSFDEKVFGTPRDGLDWLATCSEKLDPEAVLSDIALEVPSFGTLEW